MHTYTAFSTITEAAVQFSSYKDTYRLLIQTNTVLTNVLGVLVALSGSHLQLELMLGRAEMQKVLASLTIVSLKGMLDAI